MSSLAENPPFLYFMVQQGMEEEINTFQEITKISEAQVNAIKEGSIDTLNSLIREKQILIEQIDKIEKKISSPRTALKENISNLPHKVLVKLRQLHGDLQITMDEVKYKDSQALETITEVKNKMHESLGTLRNNIRIYSGSYLAPSYGKDNPPSPRFFDKKG
jgi:hypothetical protein